MRACTMLVVLLWMSNFTVSYAQKQQGGTPLGLQAENIVGSNAATAWRLNRIPEVVLPNINTEKYLAEDARTGGNRFAAPIHVDIDVENNGNWTLLETSSEQVWQLQITVANAHGLLIFYEDFMLPEGASLFVYSPTTRQVLGAYTRESQGRSDSFMTGIIAGNSAVLEYHAPIDNFEAPFHIWRVDAVYRADALEKDLLSFGFGASDPCFDNVACPAGSAWEAERNAVARIIVIVEEGSGYCSGTLLNNTAQDGRLLFLSAFHCMDGYTPLYDLWRFDFYYRSDTCENPMEEPEYRAVLGCDSLAGRRAMDFLLLDLHPETTLNMEFHFAGWDRSSASPQGGAVLSHPLGDIQKICLFDTPATVFQNSIVWSNDVTTPPNQHFRVTYSDGTIQPGSSGGALFNQEHRVVAQLQGSTGTTTCDATVGFFGRIFQAWEGQWPSGRLKDWLDPLGTDTLFIDAFSGQRTLLVTTDDDEPVANVDVSFFVDNALVGTATTTVDGRVTLPSGLPSEGQLRLDFTKNDAFTNGVTTADLIRIQRYVLGTDTIDPFKILASDVNLSNSLSTLDMIRIRKLILNIDPDFGNNAAASWQFFPTNMIINDTQHPWPISGNRTNSYNFQLLPGIRLPNFYAVKSGDANGSAETQ
ncbi:MAG: hypothetical protein R2795_22975 [Saprospiraceae bacterium]